MTANWHPDPTGQHELRYWDGRMWTEHVADQGVQGVSPLPGSPGGQQASGYAAKDDDPFADRTDEVASQASEASPTAEDIDGSAQTDELADDHAATTDADVADDSIESTDDAPISGEAESGGFESEDFAADSDVSGEVPSTDPSSDPVTQPVADSFGDRTDSEPVRDGDFGAEEAELPSAAETDTVDATPESDTAVSETPAVESDPNPWGTQPADDVAEESAPHVPVDEPDETHAETFPGADSTQTTDAAGIDDPAVEDHSAEEPAATEPDVEPTGQAESYRGSSPLTAGPVEDTPVDDRDRADRSLRDEHLEREAAQDAEAVGGPADPEVAEASQIESGPIESGLDADAADEPVGPDSAIEEPTEAATESDTASDEAGSVAPSSDLDTGPVETKTDGSPVDSVDNSRPDLSEASSSPNPWGTPEAAATGEPPVESPDQPESVDQAAVEPHGEQHAPEVPEAGEGWIGQSTVGGESDAPDTATAEPAVDPVDAGADVPVTEEPETFEPESLEPEVESLGDGPFGTDIADEEPVAVEPVENESFSLATEEVEQGSPITEPEAPVADEAPGFDESQADSVTPEPEDSEVEETSTKADSGPGWGGVAAGATAVGAGAVFAGTRDSGDDDEHPEVADEPVVDEPVEPVAAPAQSAPQVPEPGVEDAPAVDPVADEAPPSGPAVAAPGISGDLIDGRFSEVDGSGVALQNNRMLRVRVGEAFMARQGAMVAYQGNVEFQFQGGGAARFLKKAVTGEGLSLMKVGGQGDVFLADTAKHVHILNLNNSGISVNGSNVLAFSDSLDWNVERVKGASVAAGGLFNTTLRGTGWVAIVTDGEPVVLNAGEAATFADTQAVVAWSADLQTSLKSSMSAGALIGRGSGEAVQVAFSGQGFVIVQPSEGYPVPTQS